MHRMRIGLRSLLIDKRIINNKRRAELCECLCVCVCVCVCLCVLLGVCIYVCMYVGHSPVSSTLKKPQNKH